ncbi:MAG: hypothetical protein JST21_16160 [Bacteroidetes bacterium]|nr:hypothetical protein [Bacteroidota bacterium]
MPTRCILADPNGAVKTTASKTLLSEVFHANVFIKADEMAAQIRPQPYRLAGYCCRKLMPVYLKNQHLLLKPRRQQNLISIP